MEHAAQTGGQGNATSLPLGGKLVRLAAGFVAAALLLIVVFDAAEWYADQVSIPRYCESPEATLALLRDVLSEPEPASDRSTRPYIVAAKLFYLIPRKNGEAVESYLARLRQSIVESCR